ncbi:ThuA domain-containing protein [Luteimonas sp. Y-2-2-4F]|nr:ThuA domain-containing protein [Luteimonas sp. Y-2-2-4F]MCD9031402.1 ThuA domain-containing protein [Luteimonas sp. Y-2-2-4F]
MFRTAASFVAVALGVCAPSPAASPGSAANAPTILVFTRTEGFRHDTIPLAVETLRALAGEAGLAVEHGEDPAAFSPERLARYRAVAFALTTGDLLDPAQRAAFEAYVRGGGGFFGLHSAADTGHDWPFYGELVGAWFESHPPGLQRARVRFEDPAVEAAHGPWRIEDELYNYRRNPRPRVRVIATLQERTDGGGTMGADHPIAWCHQRLGGRAWYTGLGHDAAMYADPVFRAHLLAGLRYATGAAARCDELSPRRPIMGG